MRGLVTELKELDRDEKENAAHTKKKQNNKKEPDHKQIRIIVK